MSRPWSHSYIQKLLTYAFMSHLAYAADAGQSYLQRVTTLLECEAVHVHDSRHYRQYEHENNDDDELEVFKKNKLVARLSNDTTMTDRHTFTSYIKQNDAHTQELILAFRGSDSVPTLMINFDPRPIYLSATEFCHRGYFLRYWSVRDRVRLVVRDFLANDHIHSKKITVTGHSLGGACATLCAFDISSMIKKSRRKIEEGTKLSPQVGEPGPQPSHAHLQFELVTFGAPPFASPALCDSVDAAVSSTRVVNSGDPVPALTLYYHSHNGKQISLASRNIRKVEVGSMLGTTADCSSIVIPMQPKSTPSVLYYNHMSKTYVRNLLVVKRAHPVLRA